MKIANELLQEIIEGSTRLVVPKKSLTEKVPPMEPAFFNPKAKLNRDFSILAYAALLKDFEGPKNFLEGLSGVGARGLRVANETEIDKVIINDLNPSSLELAKESANLNNLENIEFHEKEACRFFSHYSKKGRRGTIVDIDPFGSPAPFFDCGIRATMHGGILSVAATDLQVLNGLFQNACKRKYGGIPIRAEYGNEIAIRLIMGCLRMVAARLGVTVNPLFVESDMHYYRVFVEVQNKPDQNENIGFAIHCKNCGHREYSVEHKQNCVVCKSEVSIGGPLWIGKMFEKKFIKKMLDQISGRDLHKSCQKTLEKCLLESEMSGSYFTLDEIGKKMKMSPPKLENIIANLQENKYTASVTSLNSTGFRTNARIDEIIKIFQIS